MLSRLAESIFWMGRYLERADATARLLEAQLHQVLEDPHSDEDETVRVVLSVMGLPMPLVAPSLQQMTSTLAFDPGEPSSIASSLAAARANARGAREAIASELWECLNVAHVGAVQRTSNVPVGPHAFFSFSRFVRDRVALADGIADATMARDHGWRFLILGRNLERVDMTARLLAVRSTLARSSSDWVTTLRCCSAHESFLRANRGVVDGPRVLRYLLLDRLFPRSIWSGVRAASSCCTTLDVDHGRQGTSDRAIALLERARVELEEHGQDPALLRELLTSLGRTCTGVSAALAVRYFGEDAALVASWRPGLAGQASQGDSDS